MSSIQDVRKRLEEATKAALAEIEAGREVLEEKTRTLRTIEAAPPSRSEAEAAVRATVEQTAASWLAQRGSSLLLRGPVNFADPDPAKRGFAFPPDWADSWWPALCGGDPDRAVATVMGLLDLVYARGGPHSPGLARQDRTAAIAKLQAEVAALGAADEKLTDEAITAGLTVEHRPDVQERKRHEETLAAQEADRAEFLRERTAAVDAADRAARGLASAREAR